MIITNNLANHGEYGVIGDSAAIGTPSLTKFAKVFTWSHNVLAGGGSYPYPTGTLRPSIADHKAQFTADYTLVSGSKYRSAGSDQQDLGRRTTGSVGAEGIAQPLSTPKNLRIAAQ